MGHLKHEDMARMIGGNINKRARKKFLKHLSRCQSCSKVFTETLKFFQEEEGEQEEVFTLPVLQKKSPRFLHRAGDFFINTLQNVLKKTKFFRLLPYKCREQILLGCGRRPLFANKRLRPAFAAVVLILVLLTLPFILTRHGHISDQVQSIKERFLSPKSAYSFSGSPDEISSALRAGIFIEDLSVVVNHAKDKELKTKIGKRLIIQLRNISPEETDKLFPNPEDVGKLKKAVKNIERLIESRSLMEPFLFGRFLEQTFLAAFQDKRPLPEDIEKFRQIARRPGFPPAVLIELDKLKIATETDDIKDACEKIEKIFFSY